MFQISESIADLIEGTNYKYVIVEKNKVIHTNLQIITDEIQNELRDIKEYGKKTLSKRTKHIITYKFVHFITCENSKVYIFTNQENCLFIKTLYNCIKPIIESVEFAEFNDYKSHYFYKAIT